MLAFQSEFADLAQKRMSGMDYAVLLFLLGKADYECSVTIPQSDIAEILSCQRQMVSRSILNLKRENVIKIASKKGYQSVYYVNPWLCIRGDEKNRKQIIRQWESLP